MFLIITYYILSLLFIIQLVVEMFVFIFDNPSLLYISYLDTIGVLPK